MVPNSLVKVLIDDGFESEDEVAFHAELQQQMQLPYDVEVLLSLELPCKIQLVRMLETSEGHQCNLLETYDVDGYSANK